MKLQTSEQTFFNVLILRKSSFIASTAGLVVIRGDTLMIVSSWVRIPMSDTTKVFVFVVIVVVKQIKNTTKVEFQL